MIANALTALFGLVLLAVLLAYFDATQFAVIGVLLTTGNLIAMMLDLRLLDLVSVNFFEITEDRVEERLAVIRAALVFIALQVLLIALLTVLVLYSLSGYFLQSPVATKWFLSVGFFCGSQLGVSGLTTILRLNGNYNAAGQLRVAVQACNTLLVMVFLFTGFSLDGYFTAIALAGLTSLIMAAFTAERTVRANLSGKLFVRPSINSLMSLLAQYKFLVSGAYFSLGWTMSRTLDVLVLAFLSNDIITGTYRVAKQCADAAQGLMDAVPQFFEPTIVSALKRKDIPAFRKYRRQIIVIGVSAAISFVIGVLIVVEPATRIIYPQHIGSVIPLAILAVTMATRSGIQPWLWPMLLADDRARGFSQLLIAGATAQISLMALLDWLGRLDAISAALTSWAGTIVVFLPYCVIGNSMPAGSHTVDTK